MRRAVAAVVRKDVLVELRTGEMVPAMLLFSVSTFVLFHFALDRRSVEGELAAGVLWMTLLFAAVLGIVRLFVAERVSRSVASMAHELWIVRIVMSLRICSWASGGMCANICSYCVVAW